MKSQGCLWDERCSKHLESLEKTVFFLNGRGLYSLGGGNPNGCCAGSEFGRAGSAECRSGHTRGHCAHYCITLLYYCTIVLLTYFHFCTLALLDSIAPYCRLSTLLYCLTIALYCSLFTLLHSSAQFHTCIFAL